jgi:hypothetical protein
VDFQTCLSRQHPGSPPNRSSVLGNASWATESTDGSRLFTRFDTRLAGWSLKQRSPCPLPSRVRRPFVFSQFCLLQRTTTVGAYCSPSMIEKAGSHIDARPQRHVHGDRPRVNGGRVLLPPARVVFPGLSLNRITGVPPVPCDPRHGRDARDTKNCTQPDGNRSAESRAAQTSNRGGLSPSSDDYAKKVSVPFDPPIGAINMHRDNILGFPSQAIRSRSTIASLTASVVLAVAVGCSQNTVPATSHPREFDGPVSSEVGLEDSNLELCASLDRPVSTTPSIVCRVALTNIGASNVEFANYDTGGHLGITVSVFDDAGNPVPCSQIGSTQFENFQSVFAGDAQLAPGKSRTWQVDLSKSFVLKRGTIYKARVSFLCASVITSNIAVAGLVFGVDPV